MKSGASALYFLSLAQLRKHIKIKKLNLMRSVRKAQSLHACYCLAGSTGKAILRVSSLKAGWILCTMYLLERR
jgi:hypothetical protein